MLRLIVIAITLFSSATLFADIYKTVDENGRVIYSDKPLGDKSKAVELSKPNLVPPTEVKSRGDTADSQEQTEKPAPEPENYQVTLIEPKHESHVTVGQRNVSVSVATDPVLHSAHRVVVFDNGNSVPGMVIENIFRGTHQIQAEIRDADGNVLGRSQPITIYVHRPSNRN